MLKKAINAYWKGIWNEERSAKSTLKYLSVQANPTVSPHNILKAVRNSQFEVKKAEIKLKMVTGTYMLQSTKARFSKNKLSAKCQICQNSDEDIKHFLLSCKGLEDTRQPLMSDLLFKLADLLGGGIDKIKDSDMLIQIILDCTAVNALKDLSSDALIDLERQTQSYCYKLHIKRANILIT